MKKLLLLWLFCGSLYGFSQQIKDTGTIHFYNGGVVIPEQFSTVKNAICCHNTPTCRCSSGEVILKDIAKPDTLRATLIVYHDGDHSFLHTMPGFVLRTLRTAIGSERYYDETFLDDRRRVIKAPLIVFSYKLK